MAGYSGTPLAKKLGLKDGYHVVLMEIPSSVKAELQDALAKCYVVTKPAAPLDFAILFVKTQAELKKLFTPLAKKLAPAGMLWIAWPKKSSGVASDLDENVVRKIGLDVGLVDVKVCAVDEVWSGLKFVIRTKDRAVR
jgi:hypothetical protein